MKVQHIELSQTYPLRSAVLRPGLPLETCFFTEDKDPEAFHLGVFDQTDHPVSIASFYARPHKKLPANNPYQLRGMATDENYRRRGAGKILVQFALSELPRLNCDLLWCNARKAAFNFYLNSGFNFLEGSEFIIPNIGEHAVMFYRF